MAVHTQADLGAEVHDGCCGDPTVLLGIPSHFRHPAHWLRSHNSGAGMSDPECHTSSGSHASLGRCGVLEWMLPTSLVPGEHLTSKDG